MLLTDSAPETDYHALQKKQSLSDDRDGLGGAVMLLLFGFLLYVSGVAFILLMPALWGREAHHNYSIPRAVTCPETHQQVGVTIDTRHAAITGLWGRADFRLSDCTRWPERAGCRTGVPSRSPEQRTLHAR